MKFKDYILVGLGLKEKKIKNKPPELWWEVAEFKDFYASIKGKTLVTIDRCFMVYQLAKMASQYEGDFAEVGVYKGGTARITAKACPDKKLFLFDTFEGMPKTDKTVDEHNEGDFDDTSLESVQNFLTDCSNVVFRKGLFPQTAEGLEDHAFSYVYIDVDIYKSTKACLEFFYPRMVKGGVMLFDDYQWKDTAGVKKALDEYFVDKLEKRVITAMYQCMVIKC